MLMREGEFQMNNYRKLFVLGINELIGHELVSLSATGNPDRDENERGHVFATLAGRPSVILWEHIGHDELRISVWWDYDHTKNPANYSENFSRNLPLAGKQQYQKFVGAMVTGWLERNKGEWVQGRGNHGLTGTYLRRSDIEKLSALGAPTPKGYNAEGFFIP